MWRHERASGGGGGGSIGEGDLPLATPTCAGNTEELLFVYIGLQ